MRKERKFVVSERELLDLLVADMMLGMLEANGVDNWNGYGYERDVYIAEYHPDEDMTAKKVREEHIDFYDVAKAQLEGGAYQELIDPEELFGSEPDFQWSGIEE